jgi:esterase
MGIEVHEEASPIDREVQTGELRLHYLDWGNEDLPPLLLLHGGFQTAHSWDFVSLALRDRYHVIALDQRGHGDSDWAFDGDYSREAHQKDIEGFFKLMGLRNVTLIGLSMGGHNGTVFAAYHPDLVQALVVVDIAPVGKKEGYQSIRRFAKSFPDEVESFDEMTRRVHSFNSRRPIEQLRGSLWHNVRQLPSGKWTWKYDKAFRDHRYEPRTSDNLDLWDIWAKVKCPTLLVRGAESDIVDQEIMERVQKTISGSCLVTIPHAGHLVTGDNPAGFIHAVRGFLSTLNQRPSDFEA